MLREEKHMKFRVVGHRKDNAIRVELEFEAQSKAQAEREALKQGIEVVRVEIVQGESGGTHGVGRVADERPSSARPNKSRFLALFLLFDVLFVLAVLTWWFWPQIKEFIPGLK